MAIVRWGAALALALALAPRPALVGAFRPPTVPPPPYRYAVPRRGDRRADRAEAPVRGGRRRTPPGATVASEPSSERRRDGRVPRRRKFAKPARGGGDDGRSAEREVARLGRIGRTDEALDLYQSVWDADDSAGGGGGSELMAKPTTRLMNYAIDACARARPPRLQKAFQIWREGMDGGKSGRRRLSPNVFTFGVLVSACARARDADAALRLLRSMRDDYKIPPNAVVYSTAISACERSQPPKPDLALRLLREATSDPTVEMGVVGYNAAISALARGGDWRAAVRLLDEMEGGCEVPGSLLDGDGDGDGDDGGDGGGYGCEADDGAGPILDPDVVKPRPDGVTYGTVMAACERSGEWRTALRYARALRREAEAESGGDAPLVMDGMALTSALHACQRLGLADEALMYLEMMKGLDRRSDDDDYDYDGGGTGDGGSSRRDRGGGTGSDTVARRRPPLRGPDEVAYRLAISACARSGGGDRWRDCIRLLGEMRRVTGRPPDVVAYTAAVGGCAEAGRYGVAFDLLDRMREDGAEPNVVTYSAVVGSCAAAVAIARERMDREGGGDQRSVREPMERALDLLGRMRSPGSDVRPNIVTYNAAIRACAEGLNLSGAFDLVEELRSDGLTPTVVTYGSLMTACERVGSVEAASRVFRMMREHQDEDGAVVPNEIVYGAAISTCRKAGQAERAMLLLRKMIREGLSPNAAVFNTVLMAQVEGQRPDLDGAVVVYRLMGSKYAPAARPNRQTYSLLIRSLAGGLRPADAETVLRRMGAAGLSPDVDLCTATVTAYERTGQPMRALKLMEYMREEGFNFYEIKALDDAFKKALRLVNVVGEGLQGRSGPTGSASEGDGEDDMDGNVDVDMLSGRR